MAYTTQQLADLDAAIAEGALIVQSDGRRVEYRTLDEMLRVRAIMARDLTGSVILPASRQYLAYQRD